MPHFIFSLMHTESFWNFIIQWTSHDYLTEKLVLAKPPQMEAAFFVKSQSVVLTFFHLTIFLDGDLTQTFELIWRPYAWMDLEEIKNLLYQFLMYFLQEKSFSPWMACFKSNINGFNFVSTGKSKLLKIVAN